MSSKTSTTVRKRVLSPQEEKVVRMRKGLRAPEDLELEFLDEAHPDVAEELRAIEERALRAVGPRTTPTKKKLVRALRGKS